MRPRQFLTAAICLLAPRRLKPLLLRRLGHPVAKGARIGCSLVLVDRLAMAPQARIGTGNLIRCRRILLRDQAWIGHANMIKGPFSLWFDRRAAVGNRNTVTRAPHPVTFGPSHLRLGDFAKVTGGHHVDLTQSVRFGDFSTLAGKGSQVWTHGYVHMSQGLDRARVDGRVRIGSNVYIGSASVIGGGIRIADGVTVGALSSVASDLLEPGLWVSQKLRHIALTPEQRLDRLPQVMRPGLAEIVYWKGTNPP